MDDDIEELLILKMDMAIQDAAATADAAALMHHQMLIAPSTGPHLHRNTKRKRKNSKRVSTKEEGDYGSDANSNKCSINDVVCQVDEDEEDQVPKGLDSTEKISKGYLENAAKTPGAENSNGTSNKGKRKRTCVVKRGYDTHE